MECKIVQERTVCTPLSERFTVTIQVFQSLAELGKSAGAQIVAVIEGKPDPVIGLATGSSPIPVYQGWAAVAQERGIAMDHVACFALDEYSGLEIQHPESYHSVIARDATEVIGLNPDLVRVPCGLGNVAANAVEYDEAIRAASGIDLQILGIGRNGHLGFNEPGSPFDSRTREINLMPETIADNARFFNSITQVPTKAITQGLGTILEARELIVVATGEAKAPAVAAALNGPETVDLPGSVLRRHPNVTWYLDEAAASLL